jgi:lysophospholipase L1-like esterase
MTPKKIGIIIGILIIGYFFLCSSPSVNNWDIKNGSGFSKVVFFGDSLTTGFNLKDKDQSYPAKLARKLNLPKTVYGFNGYTTENALTVIDQLKEEKPSLLVVTLGGNDILRRKSLKDTEKNLREIFKRLQGMGHTVVYTEVLSVLDGARHEVHLKLCKEFGIAMVPDILKGLLSDNEAMVDNIHPDVKGCEIIAERVMAVIHEFHPLN